MIQTCTCGTFGISFRRSITSSVYLTPVSIHPQEQIAHKSVFFMHYSDLLHKQLQEVLKPC